MLAAVASITSRVRLGPLVSRVALLPDQVLIDALVTIDRMAEGRLIAGLGAGDHLNRAEQAPYGMAFPGLAERLARLETVTAELGGRGIQHVDRWTLAAGPRAGRPGGRRLELLGRARKRTGVLFPAAGRPSELTWGGSAAPDGRPRRASAGAGSGWAWRGSIYGPPPDVDWPRFMAKMAGAAEAVQLAWTIVEFRRINGLPPYVFAIINELRDDARRAGEDVIDLGFGNPDIPSPDIAVEKLAEAARNPRNHRYSASRGIPKLRLAVVQPLPAPLRRRARPRHRSGHHDRGQGGPVPPDVDAGRTGRHRHGPDAELPDPHLRARCSPAPTSSRSGSAPTRTSSPT